MTEQDTGPSRTQPALRTLQLDQRELLDGGDSVPHGLRDGFPTRRDALEWYQRAITRTLGEIAEEFRPLSLVRDRTLVGALVVGDERDDLVTDPVSLDVARRYRRVLERSYVRPACNRSYNRLRKRAGEYIEDSDDSPSEIDPESQRHVAMRPTIARKDIEQADALRTLWDGFESERELLDWTHDLDEPSNGAIEADLAARIGRDATARAYFIESERASADVPEEQARRYREHFAATKLLPAFVAGIQRLEGGEKISEDAGPTGTFSFD